MKPISLDRVRRAVHGAREAFTAATSRTPWAPYVGPGASSNAGDFLLHEALKALCEPVALPVLSSPVPPYVGIVSRVKSDPAAVVLGGGTLIGRKRFRRPLEAVAATFPRAPVAVLGTGVDPLGFDQPYDLDELERWRPILERSPSVGVRGPLSADVLSRIGVPATVVGDPALFLSAEPASAPPTGIIGVCVGGSSRFDGHIDSVVTELASALRQLTNAGLRVRYFAVWEPDEPVVRRVALLVDPARDPEVVLFRRSRPSMFLSALWEADAMVSTKLHGVVLANAAAIPTVMLAYQPKCLDHHLAVGRDAYTVRTSSVAAEQVVALVEACLSDHVARARLATAVSDLRAAWMRVASRTFAGVSIPSVGVGASANEGDVD